MRHRLWISPTKDASRRRTHLAEWTDFRQTASWLESAAGPIARVILSISQRIGSQDSSAAPVAQLDSASASEAEGCGFESRRVYSFSLANSACPASSPRVPNVSALLLPRKTHAFCSASAIERISAISPARLSPRNPNLANLRRDYRALAFWPRSKFIRRLLRLLRTGRRKQSLGLTAWSIFRSDSGNRITTNRHDHTALVIDRTLR